MCGREVGNRARGDADPKEEIWNCWSWVSIFSVGKLGLLLGAAHSCAPLFKFKQKPEYLPLSKRY